MSVFNMYLNMMESVVGRSDINEEFLYRFWDYLADQVENAQEEIDKKGYQELLEELNILFSYGLSDAEYPSKRSYVFGSVWGAMRMLSAVASKRTEKGIQEQLKKKYQAGNYRRVLQTIYLNPGVQNKELARECNVETARISQIIKDFNEDNLIMIMPLGKEKFYYLKIRGKNLYKLITGDKIEKTVADIILEEPKQTIQKTHKNFNWYDLSLKTALDFGFHISGEYLPYKVFSTGIEPAAQMLLANRISVKDISLDNNDVKAEKSIAKFNYTPEKELLYANTENYA